MIAERMKKIDSSGIRKVFDLAAKMEDPINLSIGQPDFDIPEEIKQEAIKAISSGMNRYTQTGGIPELRAKLKEKLEKEKKRKFDDIMITSGVSGGLFLAFLTLINPGDEVIVPDPYFVMYKHLVNLLGGVPKYLSTYPDFSLDPKKLEALITPKTKIMLLNSPNNPTGKVYTRKELTDFLAVAKKHNIIVISDEIYDLFTYGEEFVSVAELYENTLLLGGFSKTYAMTGWRIGYAAGNQTIINEMIKLQQYTFVCAPSFAQAATLKALDYDMSSFVSAYKVKRDMIYNGLKENFYVVKPEGAFYIFPQLPKGENTELFVNKALENKVLIIPGNVFSESNTGFRISFAADNKTIEKGIEVLNKLALESFKK
ncbi:MAG TPA: aspartate aminotransferase [Spirochaetia bacterium]|nr:MAG: aspartate aminotransferase [Spirochaetes bacterium GWB1_36_13]HCL55413.1 aspartate aminotransferase [Spirochaetia bacterium]